MSWLFLLLAIVSGAIGIAVFGMAESTMHETTAGIFLLISAVFLTSGAIVDILNDIKTRLPVLKEPAADG